jgi:hypothetical protein
MASSLSKADRAKLASVFAWAQARCGTRYHLTFETLPSVGEDKDTVFSCRRHDRRKTADATHFVIAVNRPNLRSLSSPKLRRMAVHEIVHAILWPISDCVEEFAALAGVVTGSDGTKHLVERLVEAEETAVYVLQRAIAGEM